MKIQKPGRFWGDCITPLKMRVSVKSRVAMLPAVSASGRAAMTWNLGLAQLYFRNWQSFGKEINYHVGEC